MKNEDGTGNLDGIASFGGGGYFSTAVKQNGEVRTWGYNYYGQLGTGNTTDTDLPVYPNLDLDD